jgi:glutamate dehydrogenase/leucine dehydrogenase
MAQNSQRLAWSTQDVDAKLKNIMADCYKVRPALLISKYVADCYGASPDMLERRLEMDWGGLEQWCPA